MPRDEEILDAMAEEFALRIHPHMRRRDVPPERLAADMRKVFALAGKEILDAIDLGLNRLIDEEEGLDYARRS